MEKINHKTVLEKLTLKPRRRCFVTTTGIHYSEQKGTMSFSVRFADTIKLIFEKETGLKLFYSQQFKNYYRMINTDEELQKITAWEKLHGSRVFIRDCLSLSLALATNFHNESGQRTNVGELEYKGKYNKDQDAINQLADIVVQTINSLPFYKVADIICSVPPCPDKKFDLPSNVVSLVSSKINKQDVTGGFVFGKPKASIKTVALVKKWNVWEAARLTFPNSSLFCVKNKGIILIDDKYQSGITLQYIAMKLQEAGAREVYGLCFVKTLRDTGNV